MEGITADKNNITGFTDSPTGAPGVLKAFETGESVREILSRPRKTGRVLLIVPSQCNVYGIKIRPAFPAIGVMSVASMLEKAGHKASIIDIDADNMDITSILNEISKERYSIVGLTAVTATYPNAIEIAARIKEKFPHIINILGGIHATVDPINCAKEKVFDFIVAGEGECTAVELVDGIMGGIVDFFQIKGVVHRNKEGNIISGGTRDLAPDLNDFPFSAWHLIRNLNGYAPPDATSLPAVPIMVSRGCPGQCTYCNTKNIFGRRIRFRSPMNVIEEIRILVYKYKVKEIHFLDDVITANRKFVFDFCSFLKKEPYKLHLEVSNGLRADMVDKEILSALKEVGLKNIGFGIETGNERVLKLIKKGITKDQCRKAMSIARAIGLETWCFFMLGLPGDDAESIKDTVNFAIELDPKYAKFLILKPFPGSEAYFQLEEKGLIIDRDFSRYGVYTPPVHRLETLSQEKILEFQKMAYRKFYFRPRKILEHLKDIRSPGKIISVIRGFIFIISRSFS